MDGALLGKKPGYNLVNSGVARQARHSFFFSVGPFHLPCFLWFCGSGEAPHTHSVAVLMLGGAVVVVECGGCFVWLSQKLVFVVCLGGGGGLSDVAHF